ncbi:MAG: hypothetical protein IPG79_11615 [Saprospiraceae bacterium]|nr:hypothetical protein [Saprospiraceae bacterium]
MATILQTKNLTKSYGKTLALNNLTITIEQGQVVGILRPLTEVEKPLLWALF